MSQGFGGNQIADVWSADLFYALTFDQKRMLAVTIYQYHLSDDSTSLMFTDTMTGKIIGSYKPGLGLQMD